MISNLPPDEFSRELHSLCDQNGNDRKLRYETHVFNSYDPKYFYGRVTDHQFFLKRNSSFSRNSYRIDGSFAASDDGKTNVDLKLNYDKGHYWGLRLSPVLAWVLMDPFLYFKGDIPLEGLLYVNLFMSLAFLWIPVDIYRGRRMLKTFKEELKIS